MRPSAFFPILAFVFLGACAHSPQGAPAVVPQTPAGERLAWYLKVMEDGGRVDEPGVVASFTEDFLAKVPAADLVAGTRQLALQVGSLKLESVQEQSPYSLAATVRSGAGRLQVMVAVERESPHRFTGLRIVPARPERPRPSSWDAVDAELAALAPRTNLLAARIDGDRCEKLHARDPDAELAIGSTFKLWVLLAVSDAVAEGKLAWDTPIAIREGWKSFPSGILQNEPAGKTFTTEQMAREMISISDNTATDHLIRTVGREAVEAALARTGHGGPARNRPFLTTRELFLFKLGGDPEAYLAGAEAAKRAQLAALEDSPLPPLDEAASWKAPRHIDTLEWFASAADLCKAMVALDQA
ncbi:MAG TPA: serine hydrolase, partial [Vulgatibacter sp.]